jgi:hypothetical protein
VCDWGPEIRLTYTINTDSTNGAESPVPFLTADTVFLSYAYRLIHGPVSSGRDIVYSLDFGDSWSEPYDYRNPSAVEQHIEDLSIISGQLCVAGIDCRSEGSRYAPFFRKSSTFPFQWNEPVRMFNFEEYVVSDCQIARIGDTLYYAYFLGLTQLRGHVDSIFICRSFDEGTTWQQPRQVVHCPGAADAPMYFLATEGALHLVFEDYYYSLGGAYEIYHLASFDGGYHWQAQAISDGDSVHSQLPSLSRGTDGSLVVGWMDYKYGSGPGGFSGNILCRVSHDQGTAWGAERRVTPSPTAVQSAALIEDGYLAVVWEDVREGLFASELYCAESSDSGEDWTGEVRLRDAPNYAGGPKFVSDYPRGLLFWEDSRDGANFQCEIYFRRFDARISAVQDLDDRVTPYSTNLWCYPNPFCEKIHIALESPEDIQVSVEVFDLIGRLIKRLDTKNDYFRGSAFIWDGTDSRSELVPSGLYFIRAQLNNCLVTKRIVLIR